MRRPLGKTGIDVGALGLGCAEIGYERVDERIVDSLVGAALDAGANAVDTAAMYPESESLLGRVLRDRRDRVLVFTKCGADLPPRRTVAGFIARASRRFTRTEKDGRPYWHDPVYWHPRVLRWNVERSLIRLKTDHVDLLQLHSCPEEILRAGDAVEVLLRARESGKTRLIGYSGDGRAAEYAVRSGCFDVLQTSVNVADQQAIYSTIPLAAQRGMGVIAKRPIANGVWTNLARPENSHNQVYWERLRTLDLDRLRGPEDFETALRFTLTVPGVSVAIVGTKSVAHFRQNLAFAKLGPLDDFYFNVIRDRWKSRATSDWIGQV